MINKVTKKMLFGTVIFLLSVSNFSFAQSSNIKLIAFNYSQEEGTKIVRWNAGDTEFSSIYSTNVEGIISASSTFDSRRSNYFARVLDNTTGSVEARMIEFNTNSENISLSPFESSLNGGSEVDMQTGFVYSYDGDIDDNIFLNKFDPISGIQTILGYFNFGEGTNFFPDSTCYDSNSKKYYFLILEGDQVKLVTASVTSQPFTYTVIPILNTEYSGNIGLEFSNETNTIFTVYSVYNQDNNVNDEIMIGSLNPNTGELTTIMTLENIFGYLFSNRTYDQDSESILFVGFDANYDAGLYLVNTSTATYEILPFLGDVINEMECDNSSYAVSKYGTLSLNQFNSSKVLINPNPASSRFQVSFEGNSGEYKIIDLLGKTIHSGMVFKDDFIDVSSLSNGVYIFNLVHNGTTYTQKIVVN